MSTKIKQILATKVNIHAETHELFEVLDLLGNWYTLYETNTRIAGLYYHRANIDIEEFNQLASWEHYGHGASIRTLIKEANKNIETGTEVQNFTQQIDFLVGKTLQNVDPAIFPWQDDYMLSFEPEPSNRYNTNAIKILYKGIFVGYVADGLANDLAKIYTPIEISGAIGIVRKKVGDYHFTYDIFFSNKTQSNPTGITVNVKDLPSLSIGTNANVVTGNIVASNKFTKYSTINYRDYEGGMRTMLEYATSAHL